MKQPWNDYVLRTILQLSPLYQAYIDGMDDDPEILALEALGHPRRPRPITFFAIVNSLVIRDQHHPLAGYYPYLSGRPDSATGVYPAFRDFCLTHQEELQAMLKDAHLQTNEVTRCANWLPALYRAYQRGGLRPLSLVELGCSAGLNLLPDYYRYIYHLIDGPTLFTGLSSPVQIECRLEGEDLLPLIPLEVPPIARRVGVDLNPLDITNEEHVRRLLGAIWPEERERYVLLKEAIAHAQQHLHHLHILKGDAARLLTDIMAVTPNPHTVCILHSYALRQGIPAVLEQVETILADFSRVRPIYRISLEIEQGQWDAPRLELFTYERGRQVNHEWLATCEVHGDSMRWLHAPA